MTLLQVRELDANSVGAQAKPKNYVNPGAKSSKIQDKLAQAAETQLKAQVQKDNKKQLVSQFVILKHVPRLVFDVLTKVSGEEHTFMIQDMAQEMFIKMFDLAVNSEIDLKQQGGVIKQLKEAARPVAVSHNQREALAALLNIFKTYALDVIYPNEIDEIHATGSATGADHSSSAATTMFEIGTGGLGSVRTVIRPVIHKVCVHVLHKIYFQLVELIIDHGLYQFYMLPVFIL